MVLPSYGETQFLPPMIGKPRALDLMMTGRAVTAEEALSMGLLDRLRRCVDAAMQGVTDEGLAVEAAAVVEAMGSEDAREGVMAFLEKRAPRFKHR